MVLTLAVALSGCMGMNSVQGSGKVITETRNVSGFTGVEISGDAKLVIEPGDTESVQILADDNLMEYLDATVTGSKLVLGPKNLASIAPTERVTYRVVVKTLSSLDASGSVTVEAKGVQTDSLSVSISGSGEIEISGEAASQKIVISGSANYEAENLNSKEASITISGSAKAVLAVAVKLDVQVSGSADVEYIGSPQVTKSISGSGSVEQRKA
jgi:hypothetical protein